jgi:hypothetical protein
MTFYEDENRSLEGPGAVPRVNAFQMRKGAAPKEPPLWRH